MSRYFFDFDGTPDRNGIELASAEEAYGEALRAMPEYLSESIHRGSAKAEMTCNIRDDDTSTLFKITMSMHVEDGAGKSIEEPLKIKEAA